LKLFDLVLERSDLLSDAVINDGVDNGLGRCCVRFKAEQLISFSFGFRVGSGLVEDILLLVEDQCGDGDGLFVE
jgi:hypothetical protein